MRYHEGLSDRMKQTLSKQRGDIREFSLDIYINLHYYKYYLSAILFHFAEIFTEPRPGARALPVLYSQSQMFDLYKWDQISFWNEIYIYIRSRWSNIGMMFWHICIFTVIFKESSFSSLLKDFLYVYVHPTIPTPQWRTHKIASGPGDVGELFAKLNNSHFLTQSHYPTTQWTHSMLWLVSSSGSW